MKRSARVLSVFLQMLVLIDLAKGHGMLLNPAGRGSRWRIDNTAEPNYDDMSNNCGGFSSMHVVHDGRCGLCGDNYGDAAPRDHELQGKYGGDGVIVKTYRSGSQPEFVFNITANHNGTVSYEVCNLDVFDYESEECFSQYRLEHADGSDKYNVSAWGEHRTSVVLPQDLSCDHCVLRWTYYAGNNVNFCDDGTERAGCGPQESFKNCADISIRP